MANRPSRIVLPVKTAWPDGLFRPRYPNGVSQIASASSIAASASGTLTSVASGGGITADPGFTVTPVSTLAHGNLLNISRSSSNFGSHANYNPGGYQWQGRTYLSGLMMDFEDGQLQKRGLVYDPSNGGGDPIDTKWALDTTVSPANLTKSARRFYGGAEQGPLTWFMPQVTGQMYATFKFRIDIIRRSGKFWRIWGVNQANVYFSTGDGGYAPWNYGIRAYAEQMNAPTVEYDESNPQFQDVTWHRVEIWLNQATGEVTVWIDGVQKWTHNWLTAFMATDHTVDLGHMVDNADPAERYQPPGQNIPPQEWYADPFYNLTRARFELANAPVWANRTRTEIQIPTIWGTNAQNTQIAINRGEHPPGSTLWLYYLDVNNNPTRVAQVTLLN